MCKLCEKNPVYEFTNQRKLCARCFINYFQKKVLYIIRKFKMIRNNDVVVYENKGNFRGVVLEDVLKMFAEKAMVDLVKLRSQARDIDKKLITKNSSVNSSKKFRAKRGKSRIHKIAIPSTIDTESDKLVHNLIKGNVKSLKELGPVNKNLVKPLYLFLDEEVLLYAKLRKLKFKKQKIEKDKISSFIDDLEIKHPEIKRAIINSYLELY